MLLSQTKFVIPTEAENMGKKSTGSLTSANSKNDSMDSIPEQKPFKKKVNFTPQK
jgi:hypothetical protein